MSLKTLIRQQNGLALFLVIIYTIIMSILGLAFIVMTGFEEMFVIAEKRKTYAAYMAESGLAYGDAFVMHMNDFPQALGYSASPSANYPIAVDTVLQMAGDTYNEGRYSVSFSSYNHVSGSGKTYEYIVVFSTGDVGTTSIADIRVRKRVVRKWELMRAGASPLTYTAVEYYEYPYEKL